MCEMGSKASLGACVKKSQPKTCQKIMFFSGRANWQLSHNLKSSFFGMNNYELPLTSNQAILSKQYHAIVIKHGDLEHNRQKHLTVLGIESFMNLYNILFELIYFFISEFLIFRK
jgi:hypothetical protein